MSTPISLPFEKPQPSTTYYGKFDLELFRTYSREEYVAAFGVEPPPFDPSKPSKRWFDTSVDMSIPDEQMPEPYFKIRVINGTPRQVAFYMTPREATAVNLPGRYDHVPLGDVAIPVRKLKANEVLEPMLFDGWQVKRTDLNGLAAKTDRQLLEEIHQAVVGRK